MARWRSTTKCRRLGPETAGPGPYLHNGIIDEQHIMRDEHERSCIVRVALAEQER